MSYDYFTVIYYVVGANDLEMFLKDKTTLYYNVQSAFEDINQFIEKFNNIMYHANKDLIYKLNTTVAECDSYMKENQFMMIGETKNQQLFIIIKKFTYM